MKIVKIVQATVQASLMLAFVGCAGTARTEKKDTTINEAAGREIRSHQFVEVSFKPGSSDLTASDKNAISKAMRATENQNTKIDQVVVLSWADEEMPSAQQKKLSKPQVELAKRRNQSLSKYVKEVRSVDVDAYNMAEQPGTLSKWFNTTDNRLKNSMIAAGLPTTADDPQYPNKAGHAVIFVKTE